MRYLALLILFALCAALMLASCGRRFGPPRNHQPVDTNPGDTVTQGDWHTYRHDYQRTGRSEKTGPQDSHVLWSTPGFGEAVFDSANAAYINGGDTSYGGLTEVKDGEVAWEQDATADGAPYFASVSHDGGLFGGYWSPTTEEQSLRRYSADHELQWSYPLSYTGAPAELAGGGCCFIASPEGSMDSWIFCLNAEGGLVWQKYEQTFFDLAPFLSIAEDGGILGTTGNGLNGELGFASVFKLNAADGEIIWETPAFPSEDVFGGLPSLPAISDDGRIVVADSLGVYCFSADGELLWSYFPAGTDIYNLTGPSPWGEQWPPAIGPEGNIYVTMMEEVDTYATALLALSSDGDVLWRRDEHFEGAPIVDAAGTIYIGSGYGEPGAILDSVSQVDWMEPRNIVVALNPDGTTKWEFSAPSEITVGQVWCLDNEGNLVVSGNLPSETPDAQRMFWLGDE